LSLESRAGCAVETGGWPCILCLGWLAARGERERERERESERRVREREREKRKRERERERERRPGAQARLEWDQIEVINATRSLSDEAPVWRKGSARALETHSGDTTPYRMTGVTLHGVVSPERAH